MTPPYLLGLRLAGRRVVVVGGGTVAARRVPALRAAGADVVLVAPQVTPALAELAEAEGLRWERRRYAAADLDGAWLVHACTDDPAVNAAVAADADARRVFCVRADAAEAASAWTPASGGHGEVTVGVHAGRDPRRAAAVRDRIVAGLREGSLDAAHGRDRPVGVAIVGGGPGDPELVTVRARRLLAEADVVVADRLAPAALLDELGPHVLVVDAAKIPRGRAMPQDEINATLVAHARAGRFVVRLKGGDPFVFGRGGEELEACLAAGVPVTVVPGVTSAIAVPGAASIPVTHRGVAQHFTVVSGHVPPGDPRSSVDWAVLARAGGTLVLLMAVDNLAAIAAALCGHGRDAATPAAVVERGSTPEQRVLRATLGTVAEAARRAGVRPPAVVVVGEVAALRLDGAPGDGGSVSAGREG